MLEIYPLFLCNSLLWFGSTFLAFAISLLLAKIILMPYFLLIAQLCIRNVHFLNSVPIKKNYKCGHFEEKKEYWCSLDVNCFNQIKSPTKFVKKN